MEIFYSPKCLEYGQPGHPESPDRIEMTYRLLLENGYSFSVPVPCTEEDILRVHSKTMLEGLKKGSLSDGDTPALPHILDYAILSAGSAVNAAEKAVNKNFTFSLMRPPGHHASHNRVMGFCYLNSIAIASARYLNQSSANKVVILDIDCHHGNGTEDIFKGKESVLYLSLHQSPLYPGTGLQSRDNCYNFPLNPGTEEKTYLNTLEQACEIIRQYNPTLIGISAGFDTYHGDPLSHFNLKVASYTHIGALIADLKIPVFVTMEGGYSRDLPDCVLSFIRGLNKNPH